MDITATMAKHKCIVTDLPAVYVLTGCDTTSFVWCVGKATALEKDTFLHTFGIMCELNAVIEEG